MYQKDSRPELKSKIERYKALARQIPDDETAQSIRSLVRGTGTEVAPARRARLGKIRRVDRFHPARIVRALASRIISFRHKGAF
jgi:hypothetical protein